MLFCQGVLFHSSRDSVSLSWLSSYCVGSGRSSESLSSSKYGCSNASSAVGLSSPSRTSIFSSRSMAAKADAQTRGTAFFFSPPWLPPTATMWSKVNVLKRRSGQKGWKCVDTEPNPSVLKWWKWQSRRQKLTLSTGFREQRCEVFSWIARKRLYIIFGLFSRARDINLDTEGNTESVPRTAPTEFADIKDFCIFWKIYWNIAAYIVLYQSAVL